MPGRRRGDKEVPPSADYVELENKVKEVAVEMQSLVDRLIELTDEEEPGENGE